MTIPKSKTTKRRTDGGPPVSAEPVTIAYRRKVTQQQLNRLQNVLEMDLPRTERAIVLRRYERVCKEAAALGMELD